MPRDSTYEVLVFAKTEAEALEIALEALPRGCLIVHSAVEDLSHEQEAGTYRVALVFQGGPRGEGVT